MLQEPLSVELAETVLGVILNLGMQETLNAMKMRIRDGGYELPASFYQELDALPADISDPYDES